MMGVWLEARASDYLEARASDYPLGTSFVEQ